MWVNFKAYIKRLDNPGNLFNPGPFFILIPSWPSCPSCPSLIFSADKWHISRISVFGKKFKRPARNGYEGQEGDESIKNIKDVLKKDDITEGLIRLIRRL
jgi:hypothetical protein